MMIRLVFLVCLLILIVSGCSGAGPKASTMSFEGLGTSTLPFASQLTLFEVQTIEAVKNRPTTEALFNLALIMGGSVRTAEAAAPYKAKFDDFISLVKDSVAGQENQRKKGTLLFRAFHKYILGSSAKKPNDTNYEEDQTTIENIFNTQEYNCLSSAVLFGLIALELDFEVKGVLIPNHVFLEVRYKDSDRSYEVQTTSIQGFDSPHDKATLTNQAKLSKKKSGLPAMTYEQYKNREIVPFEDLIVSMNNVQHTYDGKMAQKDQMRLREIAGYLSEKKEYQLARLGTWANLASEIMKAGRFSDMIMVDNRIEKELLRGLERFAHDSEIKEIALNVLDMTAVAMSNMEQHSQAMEREVRIDKLFGLKSLRQNREYVFHKAAEGKFKAGAWLETIDIFKECLSGLEDVATSSCMKNLQGVYLTWASQSAAAQDLNKAKSILNTCISYNSAFVECQNYLGSIEGGNHYALPGASGGDN